MEKPANMGMDGERGGTNLKEMLKFEIEGLITDTPLLAQSMIGIDL